MAKKSRTRRAAKVPAGKVAKVKEPARRTAAGKKRKATTKRKEPRDVTALITAGASVESVVPATRRDDLTAWFNLYMSLEVEPGSNTYRAKLGDLKWFLGYFYETTGGYECDQWTRSLSKSFLSWIQKQKSERTGKRLAPNTCRRILDTAKRASRWIHRQRPFLAGYPYQDVKDLKVDEPDWKGLTDLEVRRLKSAAEQLIHMSERADQVPRRNFAILLVLLDTGLRAFELSGLQLDQYQDGTIRNVMRKGKDHITSEIPISSSTCEALDDYIEQERSEDDGPLFQSKNGKPINQQIIDQVVRRIAAHANSKLPKEQQIQLNPHLLRHTALRRWADKKGIRYARQISGQVSDRYIWRYTQPSRQETRDAVEELWD
jgi:integrase/recombinase XerD